MIELSDHCPSCGHYLDAAAAPEDFDAQPNPGDVTLCVYCGTLLEFKPDMKLQPLDEHGLSTEEKISVALVRRTLKEMPPPPSARQSNN